MNLFRNCPFFVGHLTPACRDYENNQRKYQGYNNTGGGGGHWKVSSFSVTNHLPSGGNPRFQIPNKFQTPIFKKTSCKAY